MAKEPALSDEADIMRELAQHHFKKKSETEGKESLHHDKASAAYDSADVNYRAGNDSIGGTARKAGDFHAHCAYGHGACMHHHGEGREYHAK